MSDTVSVGQSKWIPLATVIISAISLLISLLTTYWNNQTQVALKGVETNTQVALKDMETRQQLQLKDVETRQQLQLKDADLRAQLAIKTFDITFQEKSKRYLTYMAAISLAMAESRIDEVGPQRMEEDLHGVEQALLDVEPFMIVRNSADAVMRDAVWEATQHWIGSARVRQNAKPYSDNSRDSGGADDDQLRRTLRTQLLTLLFDLRDPAQ